MRVYAAASVDRGELGLVLRVFRRLNDGSNDDNPDITHYLGHGDIQAIWRFSQQTVGLNVRGNLFATPGGSANLDWSFPIHRNLKGYVQLFTGYGETLIDYNHRQNVIGLGVSLVDWM